MWQPEDDMIRYLNSMKQAAMNIDANNEVILILLLIAFLHAFLYILTFKEMQFRS